MTATRRTYTRLRPTDETELIALWAAGGTTAEKLAARYGLSRRGIQQALVRLGSPKKGSAVAPIATTRPIVFAETPASSDPATRQRDAIDATCSSAVRLETRTTQAVAEATAPGGIAALTALDIVAPVSTAAPPSAWAPIPASNHEASNLGQIRHARSRKILQARSDRDGYRIVLIRQGGSRRPHAVHRLVLLAFLGPPPSSLHQVAHNDADRTNNNVLNLRYATPAENGQDRRRHNRIRATIRAHAACRMNASRFIGRCVGEYSNFTMTSV